MSGEFQGDKMQDHAKRKAPKDGEVSAVAEETPEERSLVWEMSELELSVLKTK